MSFDPQRFLEEWKRRTETPLPPSKGRWTAEARKKQALAIQRWQPWRHSTGPKTSKGKGIVSQNSRRHGLCDRMVRGAMSDLADFNRQQRRGGGIF